MTAIPTTIQSSPVLPSSGTRVIAVAKPSLEASDAPKLDSSVGLKDGAAQPSLKDVQQAVRQANQSLPQSNESITFGYEEKLGQLIVQVSDKATGKVIQQLPSKDFIQYQIYMREMVGLLLDKQA